MKKEVVTLLDDPLKGLEYEIILYDFITGKYKNNV